jgi:hypothetical protein
MTNRKFYKTVIPMEILSEEPIPEGIEVERIMEEATSGDYSARMLPLSREVLDGQQAAEALLSQGSSPDFFSLTLDGEDV